MAGKDVVEGWQQSWLRGVHWIEGEGVKQNVTDISLQGNGCKDNRNIKSGQDLSSLT